VTPAPATPARAESAARALVGLVASSPTRPDELRAPLVESLKAEVERSLHYRWLEPPALALDELALALNCSGMDDVCIRKLGATVKADALVLAAGTASPRKEVVLTLVQLKPQKPTRMAGVPIQDGAATVAAARRALRALLGPVKPTRLVVMTKPTGAAVQIDGAGSSRAPATFNDMAPGPHQVSVAMKGFEPQALSVEVTAGNSTEVRLALVPRRAPAVVSAAGAGIGAPRRGEGDPGRAWTFFASRGTLAVGVVIAAFGAVGLVPAVLLMPSGELAFQAMRAWNNADPATALAFGVNQHNAFLARERRLPLFFSGVAVGSLAVLLAVLGTATAAGGLLWLVVE
jgi:hypothetical protein